jgi:alpha-galactosidase
VPYFRKNAQAIETDLVPRFNDPRHAWLDFGRTGGYLRHCIRRFQESRVEYQELLAGVRDLPTQRTHEYGTYIMEAIETGHPARINGNVPNLGLISNLPQGCCVEVPCLVDGNGIQPIVVGDLPTQLAALNRACVNVQELIVEASLTGDVEAVYHAAMMDPLTAAVCTLPQIRTMVDEMLEAQRQWLPQF